jgi:hypothetical protein
MIGGRGFVNCLGRSVAVLVAASLIALVAVQPGLPASASAPAPTIYAATNLSNTSATLNASAKSRRGFYGSDVLLLDFIYHHQRGRLHGGLGNAQLCLGRSKPVVQRLGHRGLSDRDGPGGGHEVLLRSRCVSDGREHDVERDNDRNDHDGRAVCVYPGFLSGELGLPVEV